MDNPLRRWCGYAAFVSGLLLVLASLALVASFWVSEEVALAFSISLILAKLLLVLVLVGVYISTRPSQGLWLVGFVLAVLGAQIDLADLYAPTGPVALLIGLGLMAGALSPEERKLRLGLWGWFVANLMALVSFYLDFGLLLAAAIFLAGAMRLLIGSILLQPKKAGESTMSG